MDELDDAVGVVDNNRTLGKVGPYTVRRARVFDDGVSILTADGVLVVLWPDEAFATYKLLRAHLSTLPEYRDKVRSKPRRGRRGKRGPVGPMGPPGPQGPAGMSLNFPPAAPLPMTPTPYYPSWEPTITYTAARPS